MRTKRKNLSSLTPEFLHNAYCVEKLTVRQIARLACCRNGTICDLLDRYGVRKEITKEWLLEHYVNRQESIDEIASYFERDEATIRHHLRQHGIPIRYKSRGRQQIKELNDRQWLYHHYIELNLSSCQIAEILCCGQGNVIHALKRADIPVRPRVAFGRDHTPKGYRRSFSHRKRRLVKERDNHTCQMPGCGAISNLEVHHIIAVEQGGTNDIQNGITLCHDCHARTFQHEEDFYYLFKTIVTTMPGAAHLVSTPIQLRLLA